jgi:hypothetical protein
MARNFYFSEKVRSEINLYEELIIEALKIYGQDVYYLPRTIVNEDTLLGDDPASQFASSYKIEMYIENVEGFDGEGDLFTRFGVEIRDECTFVVSKNRWSNQVARADNALQGDRPTEGDLIYLPLSKSMFEIRHVEHEQPFYQIENVPTYKMRCTLFEYSGEDMDTGNTEIDSLEKDYAYQYKVCTLAPKKATGIVEINEAYSDVNIFDSDYTTGGNVINLTLTNGGTYYTTPPQITFIGGNPDDSAQAIAIIDSSTRQIIGLQIIDSGYGYSSAPTMVFSGGSGVDSDYSVGDTVTQTLSSGVVMSGEIQRIQLDSAGDSSRCYYLAHVGADDGKLHTFVTGGSLINSSTNMAVGNGLTITGVTEFNYMSETEQNDEFTASYVDNFLNFSEDNPFGDPETQ